MAGAIENPPGVATMQVRNFLAIEEVLQCLAADPGEVLRSAGLEPRLFSEPERMVLFSDLDRLVTQCIHATGCEDFGLRVGMREDATAIGLAGLVSMNCRTVREALQTMVDGLKTSGSGRVVTFDVRDGAGSLGYVIMVPGIENVDQITDGAMAIMVNSMRQFCGSTWRPDQMFLPRSAPRDAKRFAQFFGAPITFGAPSGRFTFDPVVLDRPVNNQDRRSREILGPLLDAALTEAPSDFVAVVKSVLRGQIGAGRLTRDRVARAMGLSVNALVVRLRASGIAFRDLAGQAEFEFARALLLKGKTIDEIAADLAFADKSAFTRAFKKWAGTTPGRWRAERAASPRLGAAAQARR